MLNVCLLGTGGMMPLKERFLTSLLLSNNEGLLLVDCGEGTQIALKEAGWGVKSLNTICFTHFHADHIAGLPGLLLTLGNAGREEPINLIGPFGLKEIVRDLLVIAPVLPFDINFYEVYEETLKLSGFEISTLPVEHGVSCVSYSFYLKRQPKFDVERAEKLSIPKKFWGILQKGKEVLFEGKNYSPNDVLGEERKGIKLSYSTDLRPSQELVDFVKDSDLYIGEGIYGDKELLDKAAYYKHSHMLETCEVASRAKVKELWFTHYSPSIKDPFEYEAMVKEKFSNSVIAVDGMKKTINFE